MGLRIRAFMSAITIAACTQAMAQTVVAGSPFVRDIGGRGPDGNYATPLRTTISITGSPASLEVYKSSPGREERLQVLNAANRSFNLTDVVLEANEQLRVRTLVPRCDSNASTCDAVIVRATYNGKPLYPLRLEAGSELTVTGRFNTRDTRDTRDTGGTGGTGGAAGAGDIEKGWPKRLLDFLQTTTGLLSAIAALVAAVGALVAILKRHGEKNGTKNDA